MTAYCPYPRLFDAFRNRADLLQRPFETLSEAARAQGMKGDDAAKAILTNSKARNLPWGKANVVPKDDTP